MNDTKERTALLAVKEAFDSGRRREMFCDLSKLREAEPLVIEALRCAAASETALYTRQQVDEMLSAFADLMIADAAKNTRPAANVDGLLADMRRKYLHAKSMDGDPNWLKGEPITAQILERWIPIVESLQRAPSNGTGDL